MVIIIIIFFFFFATTKLSYAADTISSGQSLTLTETLISKEGNFELGFFTLNNTGMYYIGIWYSKISFGRINYVWIANRNTPLYYDVYMELKLLEDGNLVLYNDSKNVVWSTNLSSNAVLGSSEAVIQDDGNFVLRNKDKPSEVSWQSFDQPTDAFMPGAKLRYDNRTKKSQPITSWKGKDAPAEGMFSLELDPIGDQFVIRWNQNKTYWSSGAWNGKSFSNVPEMAVNFSFSYIQNENESYLTYRFYNTSLISRLVMDRSGKVKQYSWDEEVREMILFFYEPKEQCAVYAFCGAFGVCDENGNTSCQCMKGFQPRSPEEWNISYFSSGGCVRKTPLQCGDKDAFWLMSNVRLPVNSQSLALTSADKCKLACMDDCSCVAYSYNNGCSIWNGNLSNAKQLSTGDTGGGDLYLRLATSEIPNSGGINKTGIIVGTVVAALVLGLAVSYVRLRKRGNQRGNIITNNKDIPLNNESQKEDLELPLFDFVTIAAATDTFSLSNKIGQGGFGPVYKGVLPTGEEIAIKRLSKDSRQGLEEFMNEVLFIAKLQHRNLVRLLGCCIQGEERMLIYEYMPNKSLDLFIFDDRRINLSWKRRFVIIVGIARGLLYLHQDSRLRIIHRDLKASNILLDSEMNAKISDFGMARTLGGDQTEDSTMRVVGTYGYMSPEYAVDGVFSVKSDVYSFGVLVLEIVSGKRNRGFYHVEHDVNLFGYAWKLLNDNTALQFLDASINIKDSFKATEMLKCIQVGLLCVQRFPEDRPTMSSVLTMLGSECTMLPWPKQPGLDAERSPIVKEASSDQDIALSRNDITVTLLEGR